MSSSKITRIMTADGSARLIFAETTDIVQKAHEIHETSKTMTATLGRALTVASMMGCLLKDKTDSLSIQFHGNGPAGRIVCISDYSGNVRGYAQNPDAELPPNSKGKLDVGGAVGAGTITVVRNIADEKEPYVGVSDIITGEIAEDITNYFATSEQTPTVCALGVLANKDNSCKASGGFLLQLMPSADEAIIPILEENISQLPPVSSMIDQGITGDLAAQKILKGIEYDVFDEIDISYKCPCTRDDYIRGLMSIGADDLNMLISEGKDIETRCHYCGKTNKFTVDELKKMVQAIEESKKK